MAGWQAVAQGLTPEQRLRGAPPRMKLEHYAQSGDLAKVQRLVAKYPSGSEESCSLKEGYYDKAPLHFAARGGQLEVVRWMYENGGWVTHRSFLGGLTPLMEARRQAARAANRGDAVYGDATRCERYTAVADFINDIIRPGNGPAFARSLFRRPVNATTWGPCKRCTHLVCTQPRVTTRAAPHAFQVRTVDGDVCRYTTKGYPVDGSTPRAELQRQAWAAGAQAMGEPAEHIYFVNPDNPIAMYRPRITVSVRRVGAGGKLAEETADGNPEGGRLFYDDGLRGVSAGASPGAAPPRSADAEALRLQTERDAAFARSLLDGERLQSGNARTPCRYFLSPGGCNNGEYCPYLHAGSQAAGLESPGTTIAVPGQAAAAPAENELPMDDPTVGITIALVTELGAVKAATAPATMRYVRKRIAAAVGVSPPSRVALYMRGRWIKTNELDQTVSAMGLQNGAELMWRKQPRMYGSKCTIA